MIKKGKRQLSFFVGENYHSFFLLSIWAFCTVLYNSKNYIPADYLSYPCLSGGENEKVIIISKFFQTFKAIIASVL